MTTEGEALQWVTTQASRMKQAVKQLAAISSGSYHTPGLERALQNIREYAKPLGGKVSLKTLADDTRVMDNGTLQTLPLGKGLSIQKPKDSKKTVLLCIHMDTVFAPTHPFQDVSEPKPGILNGPGVTDAKGGIIILLTALMAFERTDAASGLSWEVYISPDEEIGSPGSAALFPEMATRCQLGLLYEPCQSDGTLIANRKGSGNFSMVIRGLAAHAGRNPEEGRNAVNCLAKWITTLNALAASDNRFTINMARITGGGPNNMVPDLAIGHFNIRYDNAETQAFLSKEMDKALDSINKQDGLHAELFGMFNCPPKKLDAKTKQLKEYVCSTARSLSIPVSFRDSGGVCDGNRLQALGLPNIDTLGAQGDHIHSIDEYLVLDSLVEKTKLSALLLMKLAKGEFPWPS